MCAKSMPAGFRRILGDAGRNRAHSAGLAPRFRNATYTCVADSKRPDEGLRLALRPAGAKDEQPSRQDEAIGDVGDELVVKSRNDVRLRHHDQSVDDSGADRKVDELNEKR